MKITGVFIIILNIFAASSINAQEVQLKYPTIESKIAFGKRNILLGLRSENVGLIEASLLLMAKIKLDFPETNTSDVQPVLDSLALMGSSSVLRYKSYLTSNICTNPEWFSMENMLRTTETEGFFLSASQQLQNTLLGMNTQ